MTKTGGTPPIVISSIVLFLWHPPFFNNSRKEGGQIHPGLTLYQLPSEAPWGKSGLLPISLGISLFAMFDDRRVADRKFENEFMRIVDGSSTFNHRFQCLNAFC